MEVLLAVGETVHKLFIVEVTGNVSSAIMEQFFATAAALFSLS
jgi:hypothetical protein